MAPQGNGQRRAGVSNAHMATWTRRRTRRLVLDLGSSAVRLCELSQTKSGYQLTKYYQEEYNSDPALSEDVRKKARLKALDTVLKASKTRTKRTIFAVPGQSVFTRSRALPPVPEYKVTQIVRYEIQQQIPFSLDQIAMDYQILDRSEGGGYDVMMAAIKVDVVEKHLDVLRESKRSIDIVDVCPFAAYNWLKHSGDFGDPGECVALIDIGAVTTDIVIERENKFRFTRPLNVGGNDVTLALGAAFGLNFTDAERVKRQRGFAPTGDTKVDGKGGEVIGGVLQRLVMEINRSFTYFRSLPGGGTVNRVILCGGGACLRNIVPYMQKQLGIEVRIAQPLSGIAVAPGAQAANESPEQSCVALGLALRCNQAAPIEINLIPPRVLEAARRREQAFYWLLIFATFALILASIIPISAKQNEATLRKIESLRLVLAQYDPTFRDNVERTFGMSEVVRELQRVRNIVKDPQDEQAKLSQLYKRRRIWLDALKLASEQRPLPLKVWFTRFETITGTPNQNQPGQQRQRPGSGGLANAGRGGGANAANGFPGIDAPTTAHSGGGRGLGNNQRNRPNQPVGNVIDYTLPKPNGVLIEGYAETPVDIREYVEGLKTASLQYPNNWYLWVKEVIFNDGDVEQVPRSALWTAERSGSNPNQGTQYNQDNIYRFKVEAIMVMSSEPPPQNRGEGSAPAAPRAPVGGAAAGANQP